LALPQDCHLATKKESTGDIRPLCQREQLIEVCAFLLLIAPVLLITEDNGLTSVVDVLNALLHDAGYISLILYFLWRNHEPFARIGWTLASAWKDAILGIGLSIPLFCANELFWRALAGTVTDHFEWAPTDTQNSTSAILPVGDQASAVLGYLALYAVSALAEETIFRGYLLLRLTAITRSSSAGVALSVGIFAMCHRYHGLRGIASAGLFGLVFTLIYLWRKSLIAPFVVHFVTNLATIFVSPLIPYL
jgi:membrane protease YdiL (CAAX protease family)